MYFEGSTIYSYGSHYPMAKILPNNVVLLNKTKSTNATEGQKWAVRRAVSHKKVIEVYNPVGSLAGNIVAFESDISNLISDINNTRKRQDTRDAARVRLNQLIQDIDELCVAMGSKSKQTFKALRKSDSYRCQTFILRYDEAVALLNSQEFDYAGGLLKLMKKRDRREKKENAEKLAEAKTIHAAWIKGDEPTHRLRSAYNPIALRISQGGEYIETSHGANVPLREAKILLDRIINGKDVKGFEIGRYTVISMNGVLKVGCHEIPREEIMRFAKQENWI